MSAERFVALGLARHRAPWFTDVARWSTSAALPLEFVKCLSVEETRARLLSGRRFSTLLADGSHPDVDRDLLELAHQQGCAVLVVDDTRVARDWLDLGADATLSDDFDRAELLQALERSCRPVADTAARLGGAPADRSDHRWQGSMVAITGVGGAGASVLAMAVAQAFADDARNHGKVLLADLALHADQALLHDAREIIPGLPELIDAHRSGSPDIDAVRRLTFDVTERGYRLLLGLRRHRDWASLRPRALSAALDTLRAGTRRLVVDVDNDVEGEAVCGSIEVEERNLLARTVLAEAELVVLTSRPDLTALRRLVRQIDALREFGVPADRLVPLINRAPRSLRGRAEISRAVAELVLADGDPHSMPNPLFVGERRQLDRSVADGGRLPDALAGPLGRALEAHLEQVGPRTKASDEPVPVAVGSLGHWSDDGAPT